MKKFKTFLITAVCAICLCFAFAGCSDGGNLVNGSFQFDISKAEYTDNKYEITYSFDAEIKSEGDYIIDYVITVIDKDGETTYSNAESESFSDCKENDTVKVSGYFYLDKKSLGDGYEIYLSSVKVYRDDYKDKSIGYAIGFGVAGGVLLCGLITVFILDKKGKLTKRK